MVLDIELRKPLKRSKSFDDGIPNQENLQADHQQLADYIYRNIIGNDAELHGPFGVRKVVYCDYIASGKPLRFIEQFLTKEVLPYYGNTHTSTNVSSQRTSRLRDDSRNILKRCLNATDEDILIFTGSGSTGAINKLVGAMDLSKDKATKETLVVFVSLQEHHSNLLPWRESGGEVITIEETASGKIDLNDLESKLKMEFSKPEKKKRKMVGCFTAASNVTGQMNDDISITALLHKYGALAFWDYAAAAPYVNIDMNPQVPDDVSGVCKKDAIYFSVHKFVGGPQTPGILLAKKKLFNQNSTPHIPGGGTVLFVTENEHRYLKDVESKEEGGTPAIVESIRAGLVFQLKETVGIDYITKRERLLLRKARKTLGGITNLVFLGNGIFSDPHNQHEIVNLPILSFLVRAPQELGGYLHHNFVCTLLNDLFGVQARGGCACAGPYAQQLLGLSNEDAKAFLHVLIEGEEVFDCHCNSSGCKVDNNLYEVNPDLLKPGFARLSLPWFAPDDVIDYVLQSVAFVGIEGWKFLSQYDFDPNTGVWRHANCASKNSICLERITYEKGFLEFRNHHQNGSKNSPNQFQNQKLQSYLDEAKRELKEITMTISEQYVPDQTELFKGDLKAIRWMILPFESKELLLQQQQQKFRRTKNPIVPTFKPKTYKREKATGLENIGSLHGGVCLVRNPTYLIPALPESKKFTKNKNQTKPNQKGKKWTISGLWSKEKLSKSKSIETLNVQHYDTNTNKNIMWDNYSGENWKNGNDANLPNWRQNSMEEKMISYLMKEYIANNKEKIFSQNPLFKEFV